MEKKMESIPYIFPVEPIEAQFLPLKTTKIKCETDFQVIQKNDYGCFMDALKMEYQSVIRQLVDTNGKPDRWLDLKLPYDCEEFVIFNVLIENGYKEVQESAKKYIYGHHFLLIFALPEESQTFDYKKVRQIIESWIKPKTHNISLLCYPHQKTETSEFDFPVQLIIDFNQEHEILFDQIKPFISTSLKQPPYLIKTTPIKERSIKSKEILIRAIQLLTTLFKIKTLISNNFPQCAIKNGKDPHRILSAKMSTYAITKATTRLSAAIRSRNLHKVAAYITSIYSNMLIIEGRLKYKFEKYFDKTRKFPKLSFADEVLRCLKIVHEILRWNLAIFKKQWFFQWNESTKRKIDVHDSGNVPLGIIVTKENFPPETFYSHFNDGNLFWAIFDGIYDISDNNIDNVIVSAYSEPLLYFNNNEYNFGIIKSSTSASTVSRQISCGLLIDICKCGSDKIRYWICESCQSLITRLTNDRIMCHCQRQNLADAKKWCFGCISKSCNSTTNKKASSQVVSFVDTKPENIVPSSISTLISQGSLIPPSTVSTPMNTTKILIVQIKREKISNGHSFSPFPSTNKTFSIQSKTTKSQTSTVTLAVPETDDESDVIFTDDEVFYQK